MAFCKVCGAQLQDGARFCESCGTPVEQPAPQPVQQQYQPQYTYEAPVYTEPQQAANQGNHLGGAIAGAIFACTFFLSLVGWIISGVTLGKIKKIQGPLTGQNKAAKIISTIGLILGIILTIFATIYFIGIIVLLISGGSSYSGSVDWNDLFDLARF
ncbi:MAG: zinc ribbon domain-containing protein [Clostridia bacterium]|nr:zinc ribbon domain-containing protein [Clostridia bacterium]MBP5766335.1 zinc ribbon domain-containing protein [Clostridia bacterium]